MEVITATSDSSRPRVQLERATVWLGVKTLYVNKWFSFKKILLTCLPFCQLLRVILHIPLKHFFNILLLFCRLGFLEAPAFEDGILEKYPNFLSIVLNHVSDDTLESSYAVTCLRACFEMLGRFYLKHLWLVYILNEKVIWLICEWFLDRMQTLVEDHFITKCNAKHTIGTMLSYPKWEEP